MTEEFNESPVEVSLDDLLVRAHVIARYRWCAEQSRLMVAGVRTPFRSDAMQSGIILHEWLDTRPRSKAELEFEGRLTEFAAQNQWFDTLDSSAGLPAKARYFIRKCLGCRIKVHPDNFRVFWSRGKKTVEIEEYKGTLNVGMARNPYVRVQYEWQLRTYIYAMRPVVEALGYQLADEHEISYWQRERGFFLETHMVPAISDVDFEMQFDYVKSVWAGATPPKLPHFSKCRNCPLAFKEKCQLRRAWAEGRFVVQDSEERLWTEPLGKSLAEIEEIEW